jgi:Homeodomain-like domain
MSGRFGGCMPIRGCRSRRSRVGWGWWLRRCITGLWLGEYLAGRVRPLSVRTPTTESSSGSTPKGGTRPRRSPSSWDAAPAWSTSGLPARASIVARRPLADASVRPHGAGWSAPAIADRMGCSPSTIYRRLDAAGIARRPAPAALTREDLIEALAPGVVGSPDRRRPCGQRVVRVPSPRPRESHDHGPSHQATDESPLPRLLRQSHPIAANVSVRGNSRP